MSACRRARTGRRIYLPRLILPVVAGDKTHRMLLPACVAPSRALRATLSVPVTTDVCPVCVAVLRALVLPTLVLALVLLSRSRSM